MKTKNKTKKCSLRLQSFTPNLLKRLLLANSTKEKIQNMIQFRELREDQEMSCFTFKVYKISISISVVTTIKGENLKLFITH